MGERNFCVPGMRSGSPFMGCCSRGTLAALLIVVASVDVANAEGFYVDAGVVGSSLEAEGFIEQLRPESQEREDVSSTERSVGWRVGGGYRISQSLAIEAGFADFGDQTPPDILSEYGNAYQVFYRGTRISIKGPYLALVGSLSMGRWAPFVKLGALRADTSVKSHIDYHVSRPVQMTDSQAVSESADTTELLVGLGVTYNITDRYGVALEATRVPDVGDADLTGQDDLTTLSLTARYSF